ncbi:MAG: MATE family efflux transporter, partial [Gammaproteobacteria bacterium]|nr:MATE family efflux transporter [Gammaproteobacteria bacterium]
MNEEQPVGRVWRETRQLLLVAGPLIANNLAIAGMNFTDAVMAGRISTLDLAAVGVGNALYFAAFLFGLGTLMALSPITAQKLGAGQQHEVGADTRQALYLSQLVAIVVIALMLNAEFFLRAFGIAADIQPGAAGYINAIIYGSPAIFAFLALRFASEGIGHTRPIAVIAALALLCNALFNYIFMYGKLGFPALGAVGCGYATAVTQWIMLAAMIWYMARGNRRAYSELGIFERFDLPSLRGIGAIVVVGVPIGIGVLAEAGLFSAAAMLMGRLGAGAAGAHQIAINYAATMFMVPLAISSATMALVGRRAGNDDKA